MRGIMSNPRRPPTKNSKLAAAIERTPEQKKHAVERMRWIDDHYHAISDFDDQNPDNLPVVKMNTKRETKMEAKAKDPPKDQCNG